MQKNRRETNSKGELRALREENTQLRATAAQLQQAETLFRGLLESAPDAIVIVNQQGEIVMVNSQVGPLFGYAAGELVGQPIEVLLPEQLRTLHRAHRNGYLAAPRTRPMGHNMALVARRKNGSQFPTEISLSPLETPEGILVTAVIRDVTDRARAAEELERQVQDRTRHLNALLQFSGELLSARSLEAILQQALTHAMSLVPEAQRGAIYLYEEQERRLALRASAGFQQLPRLALPPDLALIGLAFQQGQPVLASATDELERQLAGVSPVERQRLLDALELTELPSGLVALPLIARDTTIGVLILLREQGSGPFAQAASSTLSGLANLTASAIHGERSIREAANLSSQLASLEQQQHTLAERLSEAEAGMLQAARMAAVGQLAASIAHEINNPLYAARNCLYLLEEDLPDSLRDAPYMTMAREQLARIAGIIERMRDFYRPSRGELAPCDLNRLAEETLALAGLNLRDGTIKIIFTPHAELPEVLGNADQLRQVLLNLVLNAIEAMPDGGTLTVRTRPGPSFAIVEIQDTGVGIPPEISARMFEPFFTSKSNGTGLGLPISAHIVTQHGGQIDVESAPGQGTTFRIALPYNPA